MLELYALDIHRHIVTILKSLVHLFDYFSKYVSSKNVNFHFEIAKTIFSEFQSCLKSDAVFMTGRRNI